MEKQAKEALQKIGHDVTVNMLKEYEENDTMSVKVASIIEKVSEEDMVLVKNAQMVGQGMAMGYEMGLKNSIKEAADQIYTTTFAVIAKVAEDKKVVERLSKLSGDKFAEALAEEVGMASGENPQEEDEMMQEIAKGVAPVIVEAVGGEAKLEEMAQNSPEEFQQVVETIEQVTAQVAQEVMQEAAGGEGGPPMEEAPPVDEGAPPVDEGAPPVGGPGPNAPLPEIAPAPVEENKEIPTAPQV